jgi:hypothetical protein
MFCRLFFLPLIHYMFFSLIWFHFGCHQCSGSCFGFAPGVPLPAAEHASPVPAFLLNPPTVESSCRSPLRFFLAPSPVLHVLASSACPCFLISFSCSSIRWRRQCVALLFTFCCSLLVPVARPDFCPRCLISSPRSASSFRAQPMRVAVPPPPLLREFSSGFGFLSSAVLPFTVKTSCPISLAARSPICVVGIFLGC